jgi:hypothetical protein
MGDINLYSKLMNMRVELQKEDIKKTGENKFSNFTYYELADFLPQCNRIAANNNTVFLYQLEKEQATLTLINCENADEKIIFYLPLAELSIKGANGIQNIGGLATYTRRYLYLIAFEISESDEFDPNENGSPKQEKQDKPTDEQQKQIDEIAKKKIPQAKVHVIQKELLRTGVSANAICDRYKVADLSDITEGLFQRVMEALNKTPDIVKGDQ